MLPGRRNRAFEKHLADGADHAEIAVYLERRMRGKEILHRVVAQKSHEHFAGLFAFAEPRPQRGAPGPRPAAARVARGGAPGERGFRGFREFRSRLARYRGTGIDRVEVARVAVLVLRAVQVARPLLQLPPLPDVRRLDLCGDAAKPLGVRLVPAEDLRRLRRRKQSF